MWGYRYFRRAADGTFFEAENPFANFIWQERKSTSAPYFTSRPYLVDWDTDGLPDLMTVKDEFGYGQGMFLDSFYYVHVLENNLRRNSHMTAYADAHLPLHAPFASAGPPEFKYIFDWNGDGALDVLVCWSPNYSNRRTCTLWELNDHGLELVQKPFGNVTEEVWHSKSKIFTDWDGDGELDIIYVAGLYNPLAPGFEFIRANLPIMRWKLGAPEPLQLAKVSVAWPYYMYAVDWDNDQDMDILLVNGLGDWRLLEQLNDGSLHVWSTQERALQPLLGLSHRDIVGFIDCDGDGDWDIIRRDWPTAHLQACEHTGHTRRCDNSFLCLGTNLSSSSLAANFPDIEGFGDLRNGDLNLISTGLQVWSPGFCVPESPCHGKGLCFPGKMNCSCLNGHDLPDCSGCQLGFHGVPDGQQNWHSCRACPGESGNVCHGRGRCMDDAAAKAAKAGLGEATGALMAHGNGSCACHEVYFFGADDEGRNVCVNGQCPSGTEEVAGACRPCPPGFQSSEGDICWKCPGGKYSSKGGDMCLSCPSGTVSTAGSAACTQCPPGKYQSKDHLWCLDCPAGLVSDGRADSCAECPAGSSGKSRVHCNLCPAGTFAERGSYECRACPWGTVSAQGSEVCTQCEAGRFARNSSLCERCPGGSFAPAGGHTCKSCPTGYVSPPDRASCTSCEGLLIRATPDVSRQTCQIQYLDVAFALILRVISACCAFLSLSGCSGQLSIEDVSSLRSNLVATTCVPHRLLKRKGASTHVSFSGTGVFDLDKAPSPWTVKALNERQLTLHSQKQINVPLDTSMGQLRLLFPQAFLVTGLCHCPLIGWCLLFVLLGAGAVCRTVLMQGGL